MKKTALINNISGVCFLSSSLSLIGIPFIDLQESLPVSAYILAGIFWGGLILGIILNVAVGIKLKKSGRKKCEEARKLIIPMVFFSVLFLLSLLLWKESVLLVSIFLALMLFSIELYFYIKRR